MKPRTDYEAFLREEGLEEQRQDEALSRHLARERSKPIKVKLWQGLVLIVLSLLALAWMTLGGRLWR